MSCIVVLGFYRTGSSAIAGVLHHLGVFMGDDFDLPNENNTEGFWEDLSFKNLHKAMLKGGHQDETEKAYINLIQAREKQHPLWGVKDPLLCLLLPNLIQNLRAQCQIIHVTRNEQDIKASMMKGGFELEESQFWDILNTYKKYTAQWLHEYSQPVLHIEFSEIFSDSTGTINRIANFVQLPVTTQALEFIIPRS